MNLTEHNGQQVRAFWYPQGAEIRAEEGEKLVFQSEYHGTYDTSWIVVLDAEGKELKRHNASQIGGWVWER